MTLEQYFENPPVWMIVAFIASVWFVVLNILARVSGWFDLADRYGGKDRLVGEKRSFQSIQIGRGQFSMTNLNSIVSLTASAYSIELSLVFPFSLTMKPLVIPLADLSGATPSKMMLVRAAVDFRAAQAPDVIIRLSAAQAGWLASITGDRRFARAAISQVA